MSEPLKTHIFSDFNGSKHFNAWNKVDYETMLVLSCLYRIKFFTLTIDKLDCLTEAIANRLHCEYMGICVSDFHTNTITSRRVIIILSVILCRCMLFCTEFFHLIELNSTTIITYDEVLEFLIEVNVYLITWRIDIIGLIDTVTDDFFE